MYKIYDLLVSFLNGPFVEAGEEHWVVICINLTHTKIIDETKNPKKLKFKAELRYALSAGTKVVAIVGWWLLAE